MLLSWSNLKNEQREKLNNELRNTVPITSSFFTLATFLIVMVSLAMAGSATKDNFYLTQWVLVLGNFNVIIHLPVVLIFTVKSQGKKKSSKTSINVPPSLQYYDDGTNQENQTPSTVSPKSLRDYSEYHVCVNELTLPGTVQYI